MKRMKKLEMMIMALVVICLCIRAVKEFTKEETVVEEETAVVLMDQTYENVTALSFQYNDGEALTFGKSDGDWSYTADAEFPLNDDYIDTMFSKLENLTAGRVLEEPEELAEYGLDDPICTITLEGTQPLTLQLGDVSSLGGECYASIGDGKVYLVDDGLLDSFDAALLDLVEKEDIPYMSTVASCSIEKEGSTFPLDTETDADLIDSITGLSWGACVSYKADEEELIVYGLQESIKIMVNYVESTSVDTGEVDEEGNAVYEKEETEYTFQVEVGQGTDSLAYGRLPGSGMVYEIDAAIVESLLVY